VIDRQFHWFDFAVTIIAGIGVKTNAHKSRIEELLSVSCLKWQGDDHQCHAWRGKSGCKWCDDSFVLYAPH
jgi:hypothetical protein